MHEARFDVPKVWNEADLHRVRAQLKHTDMRSNQWVVHVPSHVTQHQVKDLAAEHGLTYVRNIPSLPNMHILNFEPLQRSVRLFSVRSSADVRHITRLTTALEMDHRVHRVHHQHLRWFVRRLTPGMDWTPQDPLYPEQWHLHNSGQFGGKAGVDVNVGPVWDSGLSGRGVNIAIVDDGYQYTHPDLAAHYVAEGSLNFQQEPGVNATDPYPYEWDMHGTACAGVAAAANNTVCGVGAAFQASMSGIRLLGAWPWTDAEEATALSYKFEHLTQIYSNSWGPMDDGMRLEGPGTLTRMAMEQALLNGRDGKGVVYTWAGGNGLMANDNCNADGYANSPFTIAVAALTNEGNQSYFSEPCAALMVTAPSSGGTADIYTSTYLGTGDVGGGQCISYMGGTSASCPLVAGVVALILEANPDLSWRDVHSILVESARKIDVDDADWYTNAAGYHVNHKYGFGLVDAGAAVHLAQQWTPTPAQWWVDVYNQTVDLAIPNAHDAEDGVNATLHVPADHVIREVQVVLSATHTTGTELEIELVAPSGTRSVLAEQNGLQDVVVINAPQDHAEQVVVSPASFGPQLNQSLMYTSLLSVAEPYDACSALTNANVIQGTIVLVTRGTCDFVNKTAHAQAAGALGVIVVNTEYEHFPMGGSDASIVIPSVMVGLLYGGEWKDAVLNGTAVNATMRAKSAFVAYDNWRMTTLRDWGENSSGNWTLSIRDRADTDPKEPNAGVFHSWALHVYYSPLNETQAPTTSLPTPAPTTVAPTTVAPTAAEPTTVAPTVAEPTTSTPTTAAPVGPITDAPTPAPTSPRSGKSNRGLAVGLGVSFGVIAIAIVVAVGVYIWRKRRARYISL